MSIKTDTIILTNNGLKQIQDITSEDFVMSKFGWIKVLSNNIKQDDCVELLDEYGFCVTVSKTTNLFIVRNGVCSKVYSSDIIVGDCVTLLPGEPISASCPKLEYSEYIKNDWGNKSNRLNLNVKFPDIISEDLAYFLGYSYGDGYVNKQKGKLSGISLACSDDYPEIKNKLANIMNSEFNVDVKINKGDGALENVEFWSISILTNMLENGILKQKSGSLIFPDKILYADTKIQMAFFSGFFDADGCAQKSKKSYRIDSVDFDFMKTFLLICFSNGILGRISYKPRANEKWRDMCRFGIVGAASVKKLKHICYMSHKISTANFINVRDSVLTIYKSCDFKIPYYNYSFINNCDYFSYESFNRLKESTNLIHHKPLIKTKLVEHNDVGFCDVYDLVVDGEGFWANGFYVLS